MTHAGKKRLVYTAAVILVLFVTSSALVGGIYLLTDSAGSSLGISRDILSRSPFYDFVVPGVLIFGGLGITGLMTAFSAVFRTREYYRLVLYYGVLVTAWMVAQGFVLRNFNVLQVYYLLAGLMIVYLASRLRHFALAR